MALTMGQGTVIAGSNKFLAQIPPGPGQLLIAPSGGSTSVLIGLGTSVSATNGFPVPAGGLSIPLFTGGGPGQLYAITTAGTVSVSWIISNSTGQTGL